MECFYYKPILWYRCCFKLILFYFCLLLWKVFRLSGIFIAMNFCYSNTKLLKSNMHNYLRKLLLSTIDIHSHTYAFGFHVQQTKHNELLCIFIFYAIHSAIVRHQSNGVSCVSNSKSFNCSKVICFCQEFRLSFTFTDDFIYSL